MTDLDLVQKRTILPDLWCGIENKTHEKPNKIQNKTHEKPNKTHEKPSKTHEKPNKTHGNGIFRRSDGVKAWHWLETHANTPYSPVLFNDMKTPPPPPLKSGHVEFLPQKVAQCSEINEISIFWFLVFEIWSLKFLRLEWFFFWSQKMRIVLKQI